jgi:hypothetical protein
MGSTSGTDPTVYDDLGKRQSTAEQEAVATWPVRLTQLIGYSKALSHSAFIVPVDDSRWSIANQPGRYRLLFCG